MDDVLGKEYSGAFDEVMKKADRELRRVRGTGNHACTDTHTL